MLPIERQNQIKELISKKENVKISELSEMFSVSEMTIHRDIKPLIEEGSIQKTFGGITKNEIKRSDNQNCIYCNREVNTKLSYRLILRNNEIELACCSHCGLLRHQQVSGDIIQALCHDFFTQTTINARNASYVMDTTLDVGCCEPQVLTFKWQEHADKFIKGFDGVVLSFEEALKVVNEEMSCSNH